MTKDEQAALLHAQKLEAIGQLAAGIAHEINTPTQYVTDNTEFLARAFTKLADVIAVSRDVIAAARTQTLDTTLLDRAEATFKKTKVDYLMREAPSAIEQSLEGLRRVACIVAAMKDFSHPSGGDKVPVDLNEAIRSTVTVATNEWKYVAELELDLDATLPQVRCLRDEINQVILNLVINAAHAIAATERRGTITVATKYDNDWVEVHVSDTGTGIPANMRARVFEPFFTTKPVGRGTGQGLAIAYGVIVEKHKGDIGFETELGKGTTFTFRIPRRLEPPKSQSGAPEPSLLPKQSWRP